MYPQLVSFSGYATSGKDAAADLLVQRQGYVKTYMSKPLEYALLTLDPFVPITIAGIDTPLRYTAIHAAIGYDRSKTIGEVRRLLQTLGTEIGRNMFGEDAWLNLVVSEIIANNQENKKVCLTGVRYTNELEAVKTLGGVSVWINRPGVKAVNSHSSDNTLSPSNCDVIVENDGSFEDLYEKLRDGLYIPTQDLSFQKSNWDAMVEEGLWASEMLRENRVPGRITKIDLDEEIERSKPKIINHPECKFEFLGLMGGGELKHATYEFKCSTHKYSMFMPIEKAPAHCSLYETETE